ncbi:hypothetical protein [Streptomyces sp. NPDC015345]|uniref:hypothetical protein n=1 Tax=Streptomyces sp. NPDC015345 TaxID=3364953 RepID=UPI0036FCF8FA
MALCFHHSVQDDHDKISAAICRLRALTRGGDYAYYADIAHFMAALPLPEPSISRWLTSEADVRSAWRGLVQARQDHLRVST